MYYGGHEFIMPIMPAKYLVMKWCIAVMSYATLVTNVCLTYSREGNMMGVCVLSSFRNRVQHCVMTKASRMPTSMAHSSGRSPSPLSTANRC